MNHPLIGASCVLPVLRDAAKLSDAGGSQSWTENQPCQNFNPSYHPGRDPSTLLADIDAELIYSCPVVSTDADVWETSGSKQAVCEHEFERAAADVGGTMDLHSVHDQ